ncbi:MAG: NAD(P)/FAD-dependent oxidoreductase [Gemmatimonadetes bacterium]|nr:NAD(P)/FAD-dependent oxidoreductase [Gemmatimonadota bacterium]
MNRSRVTPRPRAQYDVIVLGSGPAGCAAATLLAREGHAVALVRPGTPAAAALGESIPPSARRILAELDFLAPLERAALHANRGNVVWWSGEEARSETFPDGQLGFHTDRASLEAVLLGTAERAGVSVLDHATARSAAETPEGWRVVCEREGGPSLEVWGDWVVDATGRHGLVARTEGRRPDRGTSTLALVRRWRRTDGWPDEHAHRTLIESYADGWAWSVPLDDGVRCVAAMIGGRRVRRGRAGVAATLEAELTKTRHLKQALEGATTEGEAWACSASLYTAGRFARPGLLLAGDAGSFIDPLSSFGVKKALSSGWLAGIAAHTALVDSQSTSAAIEFFDRREADVYRRYRNLSAPFFERAAAVYATPYWEVRARAARRAGGEGPDSAADPDRTATELPETEVRAAYEVIRARPTLDAVVSAALRRVDRPAIEGHRIVLQEHLASVRCPEGIRHVRGVDLRQLVASAPGHGEVPDAWAAYNGAAPPVTLPDYLTALATAFAAGFLQHG